MIPFLFVIPVNENFIVRFLQESWTLKQQFQMFKRVSGVPSQYSTTLLSITADFIAAGTSS